MNRLSFSRSPETVVLFIFNRPDLTRRVLEVVRAARPAQLLVIADGPRIQHPEDAAQCAAVRALIDQMKWECPVHKNYASNNMGTKRRLESGLDWVFARTESAILLEDDFLPHPSFFEFCSELLERYRESERVMAICGTDLTQEQCPRQESYRFSRYPVIWGWATWRRAWRLHDPSMTAWSEWLQTHRLNTYLGDAKASRYWSYILQSEFEASETWDYAWMFSAWRHNGLSIHPTVNLVSNIGFGTGASHTRDANSSLANRPVREMKFPLQHPNYILRDAAADHLIEERVFSGTLNQVMLRARQALHEQRATNMKGNAP